MSQISVKRAALEIGLFTLLISGPAAFYFHYWVPFKNKQQHDSKFHITSIVQTGPQKEALKTVYLSELLGISCDKPSSVLSFNVKEAEKKLLSSPVIKEAVVKIQKPSTLHVDYTVRKPIAWLFDYTNSAIDEDGYFFPVSPFFTPKNLPEIYLGLPPFSSWKTPLSGRHFELALKILRLTQDPQFRDFFNVKRIDVANAYAESYGMREIVLITEDEIIEPKHIYFIPRSI